jgi:hypothetical protein
MGKQQKKFGKYVGPEIRITEVNEKLKEELVHISEHLGHSTLNGFLKTELRKIRDAHPEHMRKAPVDF